MDNVLVTGGAGFIGSHLVATLVEEGHRVRVLDSFETGKRENVAPWRADIELVEGDIRDLATCKKACAGVDIVFHQAALPSVPRSVAEPLKSFEITLGGTNTLLVAAREAGVRRVVQASSSSVYGDQPTLPKHEGMPPAPRSPYAAHKLGAEQLGVAFAASMGIEVVALRYFNVFGPRQDPTSQYAAVVPKFIVSCLQGERPTIYGDGEQSRDFTYVANVVDANLRAAHAPAKVSGCVYNVACGERVTVNELFHMIRGATGAMAIEPIYVATRAGDVKHSLAAIDAARQDLGYEPRVSLRDGLEKTVAAYRDRLVASRGGKSS
ncbi:MAG TPA: SDR family oxidoreductase [Planctomycetota bacterium]|nr:SDR family oxidoreductase [Planctomycetota bacterium]